MDRRSALLFGPILVLGLALAGCGRKEQPQTEKPPEAPKPREIAATVAFCKGGAAGWMGTAWSPISIGQELAAQDSLSLEEEAQVELKDPEGKAYKLAGPARGLVNELMAAAATPERSAASKAVSKIKKLEGTKQTFSTQTPTAVAGIRGAPGKKAAPDTSKKDSLSQ